MVKKCDEFTVAASGAGAAYQQYGLTGAGVTVAVVDSGVRSNADLKTPATVKSRLIASQNFVPSDTSTDDLCGHGTHIAGIIAGNGAASTGSQYTHTYYGIARQANLVSARVLDANGSGSVSTVLAGLQWVVQNRSQYNIRVLNLSLGHPVGESYTTDPLCQAVEAAYRAGIVVVCAAGNNGRASAQNVTGAPNEGWGTAYGSIQSPGNDPYVITVGATKSMDGSRAHDKIATYSSRGPSRLDLVLKPDIIAPGNKVISTYSYGSTLFNYNVANNNSLPIQTYSKTSWNGYSTDYFRLSGTSMASPVVAGAAALLLQASPSLSPDTVKAAADDLRRQVGQPRRSRRPLHLRGRVSEHPRRDREHCHGDFARLQPRPDAQQRRDRLPRHGPRDLGVQPVGDRHHRPAGDLGQLGQLGPGDLGQRRAVHGPGHLGQQRVGRPGHLGQQHQCRGPLLDRHQRRVSAISGE